MLIGNFHSPAARFAQRGFLPCIADEEIPRYKRILLHIHGTRFVIHFGIRDLVINHTGSCLQYDCYKGWLFDRVLNRKT